ncbi:DNA glycosylase [Lipomyces tetrasporus]
MNRITWSQLKIPIKEISLDIILPSGQSFRWRKHGDEWVSVLNELIVILRQEEDHILYRSIPSQARATLTTPIDVEHVLQDYFNASIKLSKLYREFGARDRYFKTIAPLFSGIRILRQDPWETLCSFICSTNNSIKRITQMIDNICLTFGTYVATYDGVAYYTFPRPEDLCASSSVVQKLRELGFGYRAPYVYKTALQVHEWELLGHELSELRGSSYEKVREFLMELPGVGPKVADCVCLMAFDCHSSVPIDTHMWNIVQRRYAKDAKIRPSKSKTLSKSTYDDISSHLRGLWGDYAGWAQSVLFISELRKNA